MMLSVVVLTYNDFDTTNQFVKRIQSYSNVDNIIVVDNSSQDDSFFLLSRAFRNSKKIDVIQTNCNGGYASGNNFGIRFALSKYSPDLICISNPDIIVREAVIDELIDFSKILGSFGIFSAEIFGLNNKRVSNFIWKLPTYFSSISSFLVINKIRQNAYIKHKMVSTQNKDRFNYIDAEVIPGCFFIANTKALVQVGLFDENTFLYGEETILAYKLKEAKYKNYILLGEKVIHKHSVSINKTIRSESKKLDLMNKSLIYFLKQYLNASNMKVLIYKILYLFQKVEVLLYQKLKYYFWNHKGA